MSTVLVVMAGLPGSGKSVLARAVGRELAAPVVSVDPVEAAMWRSGVGGPGRDDVPTGLAAYAVVGAVADDLLADGLTVVVDAVNAVEPARAGWRDLARAHRVSICWVEVVCSDTEMHRRRLVARGQRYAGIREPTWEQVRAREVDPWHDARLVVDSVRPVPELLARVMAAIGDPELLEQEVAPDPPRQ